GGRSAPRAPLGGRSSHGRGCGPRAPRRSSPRCPPTGTSASSRRGSRRPSPPARPHPPRPPGRSSSGSCPPERRVPPVSNGPSFLRSGPEKSDRLHMGSEILVLSALTGLVVLAVVSMQVVGRRGAGSVDRVTVLLERNRA